MTIKTYLYILLLFFTVSCKKFIEINAPKTQLVSSSVFTSDATAKSAMDGIYSQMISTSTFASVYISLYCGLSADELDNYSTTADQVQLYTNSIATTNADTKSIWTNAYNYIYDANAVLEGLSNSTGISAAIKKELEGEAKFTRAYCNFYLTNLFGAIPLVLTTNYKTNASLARTGQDSVYAQIIKDLTDAQTLLASDYSFSGGERVRPNKYAATALLARVYQYRAKWTDAEQQATTVINNPLYQLKGDLDSVFLKNSTEAIWQLEPVRANENTREGITFILSGVPRVAALSIGLVNSFEPNDNRRKQWIDSIAAGGKTYYFPYKYKIYTGAVVSEYYMMLRVAEQYLIRAEARAEQDKISGTDGAIADLNVIRNRVGLPNYSGSTDKTAVLAAILKECRSEFFAEWGHRWLDLKRTNNADNVLGSKPNWQATDVLYPIPQTEIANDPQLSQNPGYQPVTN